MWPWRCRHSRARIYNINGFSLSGGHVTVKSLYAISFDARNAAIQLRYTHTHTIRRFLWSLVSEWASERSRGGGVDYRDLYCLLWRLTRADVRHEWATASAMPSYYYYRYFVRPPRPCNQNAEAVIAATARILFLIVQNDATIVTFRRQNPNPILLYNDKLWLHTIRNDSRFNNKRCNRLVSVSIFSFLFFINIFFNISETKILLWHHSVTPPRPCAHTLQLLTHFYEIFNYNNNDICNMLVTKHAHCSPLLSLLIHLFKF